MEKNLHEYFIYLPVYLLYCIWNIKMLENITIHVIVTRSRKMKKWNDKVK